MIDVNPQEVMMLTEQMLRSGWIKGSEYGSGVIDDEGQRSYDAQGVCVAGALRDSLTIVLRPQIEQVFSTIPEVQALLPSVRKQLVGQTTKQYADALHSIFRQRIEAVLGTHIESWNDASERRKQDVLDAMRASLELITQECLQEWEQESAADRTVRIDEARVLAGVGASKRRS
jgi:hypothetical protein